MNWIDKMMKYHTKYIFIVVFVVLIGYIILRRPREQEDFILDEIMNVEQDTMVNGKNVQKKLDKQTSALVKAQKELDAELKIAEEKKATYIKKMLEVGRVQLRKAMGNKDVVSNQDIEYFVNKLLQAETMQTPIGKLLPIQHMENFTNEQSFLYSLEFEYPDMTFEQGPNNTVRTLDPTDFKDIITNSTFDKPTSKTIEVVSNETELSLSDILSQDKSMDQKDITKMTFTLDTTDTLDTRTIVSDNFKKSKISFRFDTTKGSSVFKLDETPIVLKLNERPMTVAHYISHYPVYIIRIKGERDDESKVLRENKFISKYMIPLSMTLTQLRTALQSLPGMDIAEKSTLWVATKDENISEELLNTISKENIRDFMITQDILKSSIENIEKVDITNNKQSTVRELITRNNILSTVLFVYDEKMVSFRQQLMKARSNRRKMGEEATDFTNVDTQADQKAEEIASGERLLKLGCSTNEDCNVVHGGGKNKCVNYSCKCVEGSGTFCHEHPTNYKAVNEMSPDELKQFQEINDFSGMTIQDYKNWLSSFKDPFVLDDVHLLVFKRMQRGERLTVSDIPGQGIASNMDVSYISAIHNTAPVVTKGYDHFDNIATYKDGMDKEEKNRQFFKRIARFDGRSLETEPSEPETDKKGIQYIRAGNSDQLGYYTTLKDFNQPLWMEDAVDK